LWIPSLHAQGVVENQYAEGVCLHQRVPLKLPLECVHKALRVGGWVWVGGTQSKGAPTGLFHAPLK